jgi:hypothetical protein
MTMSSGVSWQDLETKGFVHVPQFLSQDELAAARADYAAQPVDPSNRNYVLSVASERAIGPLRHRIQDVLTAVRAATCLQVDVVLYGGYFASKGGTFFPWHQDHENFTNPNHFDYLNFYMPVHKPVRSQSNLCVVPFDALARESPKTFRRVVRRGASTTYDLGGRQLVLQDESGTTHLVRVNLEDVACTPQLEAGDLLLMRGDVFHRTEDNDTERVALSIRTTHSQTVVRRAQLANGGLAKAARMARQYQYFETMFRAFEAAGRDELPLGELLAALSAPGAEPSLPDSYRFRNRLLKEKIRGGVVCSSVRIALSETIVRPLVGRYHWRRLQRAQTPSPAKTAARTT